MFPSCIWHKDWGHHKVLSVELEHWGLNQILRLFVRQRFNIFVNLWIDVNDFKKYIYNDHLNHEKRWLTEWRKNHDFISDNKPWLTTVTTNDCSPSEEKLWLYKWRQTLTHWVMTNDDSLSDEKPWLTVWYIYMNWWSHNSMFGSPWGCSGYKYGPDKTRLWLVDQ